MHSTTAEFAHYWESHEAVGRENHLKDDQRAVGRPGDTVKLTMYHLELLGHLASMPDNCIPEKTLFSWLPQLCPRGGPRRRWRNLVKRDMKDAQIHESSWYEVALHRGKWHTAYSDGLNNYQQSQLAKVKHTLGCQV